MTRRRTIAATLCAIGLASSLVTSVSAEAATDTTPPTLNLEPYARLQVGTRIWTGYETSGGVSELVYWQGNFQLNWTAEDPSGICAQELAWQGYSEHWGEPDSVLGDASHDALDPAARSFGLVTNAFDFARIPDRWVMRSTDCAGNTATSGIATVTFDSREDDAAAVSYKGRWRRELSSSFSAGGVHSTKARGASLTAGFPGGGPVALVMDTGPTRGKADVYVDGALRSTVDTYAASDPLNPDRLHQVVVWQDWFGPGTHTLKVVNRATRGRPRIAFDLLVVRG